jgi:HAD superfamily hydrolase (TIGR01509 family)
MPPETVAGRPVYRAVLFDVGGPLNTEVEHERLIDADIRAALAAQGVDVTDAQYTAAVEAAVRSYAWDAYSSMIWHLARHDATLAEQVSQDFRARAHSRPSPFELRPGIAEVLSGLRARGLRLGLAANQPQKTLPVLDAHGIGHYFHHREVSGTHGFHKPDPRLFLRACEDIGVEPADTIMVGDRIDNDIAPARRLGMAAVLMRTGRHRAQQPRSLAEMPHAEVRSAEGLQAALHAMLNG